MAFRALFSSIQRQQVFVITGENLGEVESAKAEGLSGQGTIEIEFEVDAEERSMTSVRLRFPSSLNVVAGGLFLLTILTPAGDSEAQVFFLQGQDGVDGRDGVNGDSELDCAGGPCILSRDLVVEGDITGINGNYSGDLNVAGAGTVDTLEVNEQRVTMSVWLPDCPSGYERDPRDDIVLCTRDLGGGVLDEMVKVGDFWVDRYESSVWENPDCTGTQYGDTDDWPDEIDAPFPYHGSFTEPLFACSVTGVTPSRYLTWFQAQSACAASGKRLLSSAQWQAAVAGTVDPGESTLTVGACWTGPGLSGPRLTGSAGDTPGGEDSCISYWGAEDMIGNLWEWVEDWYGQGGDSDDGNQPGEYFSDGYWNVDEAKYQGPHGVPHFPAAGLRGGRWNYGTRNGAFAVNLTNAPSNSYNNVGFRCARNH